MINLKNDEKIQVIKRRHWLVFFLELFPITIVTLLLFLFSLFLLFSFPASWGEFFSNNLNFFSEISPKYFLSFLISCVLLICWQIIFLIIIHYFLDCWIVTNKRTIHFELVGLFSKKYASIDHDKIQDITIKVNGFLPVIFKYGNLRIQTAGAFKEFIFKQIPDPFGTKEIIIAQQRSKK